MLRDGNYCLFTELSYFLPIVWWPTVLISSRFLSTRRYPYPLDVAFPAAIEMFTGSALDTQTILDDINHPRKLNLQSDAHDSMDKIGRAHV